VELQRTHGPHHVVFAESAVIVKIPWPGPRTCMGSKRALRATNRSQLAPKWSRQCAGDGCRARYCLPPPSRQASSANRRCCSMMPSTHARPHRAGSVDRRTLKMYITPSGDDGTTADVFPSHLKCRRAQNRQCSVTSENCILHSLEKFSRDGGSLSCSMAYSVRR
jgi:hypothetical protein